MKNDTMHILLADDDEDDREFFKEAFQELKLNTKVHTVKDGHELMVYLLNTDMELPHVIFLDLNMPRKTGMECLKEIKMIERLKDITIAIYSTSSSYDDIEDTFVKGANVYIKKPSDFGLLKKILSQVISINWQYQTSGLNKDNFLLNL